MSSFIDENSYSINNQISGGSRSSILLSHVEFKLNEEEDDLMSAKSLQTKYNVLTNDNKFSFNNTNNESVVKLNGQMKMTPNLMNGNTSDNSSDGIADPKHVLYSRERVLLEWKETLKIGSGLTNLGNTCFLNSVLQCLTYCPPLVNYLLHTDDHNQNKCNSDFCMVCEMTRHIRLTRSHTGEAIKPINICRRLKSIAKHLVFGRQEDAHEFLRYVIDNMWKSCLNSHDIQGLKLDPLSKETTAINQIFGGYHRSQVFCLQCKAKSNTYDYFMDFMLDIKNVSSLEKALEKFVAPEILQHEDAYKCTRCKRKVLAKKQFTVYKAPNVATFQFKRFDYNKMFGGKITKPISYPEKLNLRPYMSESKGPPIQYKLNSVLVHLGPTCNSGHYFCYVRNSNNCWYLMDDSRIIQVNQNQVLNQQAYILFYVRVDTDFHRPAPVKNFMSQMTPNGIKLSNISSPELAFNNQKLNNYNSHKLGFTSLAQNTRKPNPAIDSLKVIQQSDPIKQENLKRKQQNSSESLNNHIKGLVPYASDSSDEELPKQSTNINGNHNSNCDKSIENNSNNHNISVSSNDNKSKEMEKSSPKIQKLDNNWTKLKTSSNQCIPNIRPKSSLNIQTNNTSETPSSCVPLAPITLKVKATTSSWHVVETALRSPSITSNSSTNSVNSTTEWTVSECPPDCNGNQHSKHHKHRNKQKRCPTIANGNVSQILSTKQKIPQSGQQSDETHIEPKPKYHSSDAFRAQNHSNSCESQKSSPKKNEVKHENSFSLNSNNESNDLKNQIKDWNHWSDSNHQMEPHFDRRSISSHRSSNESLRDIKIRNKDHERSHSKSANNSDDSKSTGSGHKHGKKKHKKHKSNSIDSEPNEETIKIKHKKKKNKKLKKKKHKRRETSDSDSNDSDDNRLQWVERTKETVDKERDYSSCVKSEPFVKQWDEKVNDLTKNSQLSDDFNSEKHATHECSASDAVNGLLKTNSRGYGDKVNSWNGGPSSLSTTVTDKKQMNDSHDDYDEEYDRGKTKKIKTNKSDKYFDSNHNPFQSMQTERHRFNGNCSSNRYKSDFKNTPNNHKPWKSYHNRHDSDRRQR